MLLTLILGAFALLDHSCLGQYIPQDQFDPSFQTCCCGVVFGSSENPFAQEKFRCCGSEPYDPEKHTCCQGVLNRRKPEAKFKCCHRTAYNPDNYACFSNGTLVHLPGKQKQCGDLIYKQHDYLCCDGILVEKTSPKQACCGSKAYSVHTDICCNGRKYDKLTSVNPEILFIWQIPAQCCGTDIYDPRTDICCDENGLAVVKNRPVDHTQRDMPFAQCGASVYAPRDQTCCCGEVIDGQSLRKRDSCCKTIPYNYRLQICCQGTLYDKDALFRACCGDQVFDHRFESCCQVGEKLVVMAGIKVGSCLPAQADPNPQIFCQEFDSVDPREGRFWADGPTVRCCGSIAYDTRRESCCITDACDRFGFGDKLCEARIVKREESTPGQVCTIP